MARPHVTVLVVDDLASFRRVARQVVEASDGFHVVGEADSGERAIVLLTSHLVDLVLMDVHMPGIGGLAATQIIRRHFPTVRVILLSVREEHNLPYTADSIGAQFCSKAALGPTELEELWRAAGPRKRA